MSASVMSRDLWLKALEEVGFSTIDKDPSCVTVMEFAKMCGGVTHYTASRRLKKLVAAGKAERIRALGYGTDGRRMTLSAYRLIPAPASAKKTR